MLSRILIGAFYITFICLSILFVPPIRNLFGDVDVTYLKSAIFAVFMMSIAFNGFSARADHINPFAAMGRNKTFVIIMLMVFVLQFVFVSFGGKVLSVEALSPSTWLICLVMAFLIIPINMIRKAVVNSQKK